MTAPTRSAGPALAPDTAGEPRAAFTDLVAAEWIRFRSLRSTWWVLGVCGALVVTIAVSAAWNDQSNWHNYPPGVQRIFVPVWAIRDAYNDSAAMITMLMTGPLGATAIAAEHATGLARTTFTAVPARRQVLTARVLVVTAVTGLFGVLVAGVSFWGSQAILARQDIGMGIGDDGALRAVAASALLAPVSALTGMALGALLRHTAGAVAGTAALLLLAPSLVNERYVWTAAVDHALPLSSWEFLTGLGPVMSPPEHGATAGGSWTVYALWPLAAVAV
ncbi:ABC transporter permease, partial [Streptomyces sp. MS19]|uniref:ABC transporter permease n=1 Tax=Streptomyces sp. MS19 TaxID=3385972 RepID=UPI0039A3D2EA